MKSRIYFFGQLMLILLSVLPLIRSKAETPEKKFEVSAYQAIEDNQTAAFTFNEKSVRANP